MKITSRMLSPEVVQAAIEKVNAQIESDHQNLMMCNRSLRSLSTVDRISTILKLGLADREKINHDIFSGKIF